MYWGLHGNYQRTQIFLMPAAVIVPHPPIATFPRKRGRSEATTYFPLRTISFTVNILGGKGWLIKTSSAVQTLAWLIL